MTNDYRDFRPATLIFEGREADIAERVVSANQNPITVFRNNSVEFNLPPFIPPKELTIGMRSVNDGHATF